jgi:tetratricopeptide (TPR) repeat protein
LVTLRSRWLIPLALVLTTLARADIAAGQTGSPPDPAQIAAVKRRLMDAVRAEPASFNAQHALAVFYLQQGDLKAAIPHLRRAHAIDPADYDNGYNLGLALLETGAIDESRRIVAQLLKVKETGELYNLLGDIEERAGNLDRAADHFQRAAHMDATEEHLFDWGNIHLQRRAGDNALQVFTAGVQRYPGSARLQIGLGIAQYSRGMYSDAVASFCRAVDLDPSDPRPYDFLGEIYGIAPDLGPEVTERLAGFVKAHPKNANAHLYYALSLWKGHPAATDSGPIDLARVESLLRKAVVLDPKLTRGFVELGTLLSDQQRYEDAIEPLVRATRLEPRAAEAHYRLAQAYRRTGRIALAEQSLQIFQQLKSAASK